MSSDVLTPDVLGPKVVGYIDWLIERAGACEGKPELGSIVEELCQHYRALAICLFADDGNSDDFFVWLLHSPLARRHYLDSVHAKGLGEPRDGRASFVDPVLDAIVARQWTLAGQLVSLVSPVWLPGEEYEEDFCYGEALSCALAPDSPPVDLARWQTALEGGTDLRLGVVEAWQKRDAVAFEQELRALLDSNAAKARAMADPNTPSILASNYPFAPNRWVSIEGLAWLALAERVGMATDYELEGCPRVLRKADYPAFLPRAYPNSGIA